MCGNEYHSYNGSWFNGTLYGMIYCLCLGWLRGPLPTNDCVDKCVASLKTQTRVKKI